MHLENGNGFHSGIDPRERGGVVQGEADEITILEPYPEDKYQAVREGLMSTEDFIEDLVRHVREGIDRAAAST
jgi:hypothetical protein